MPAPFFVGKLETEDGDITCGKAASAVKLHSQEMMLAQVGLPLAIENAHRNFLDMEDDNSRFFANFVINYGTV